MDIEKPTIDRIARASWSFEELDTFLCMYRQSPNNCDGLCEILTSKSRAEVEDLYAWANMNIHSSDFTKLDLWHKIYSIKNISEQDLKWSPRDPDCTDHIERQSDTESPEHSGRDQPPSRKRLFPDGTGQHLPLPQKIPRKRSPLPSIPMSLNHAPPQDLRSACHFSTLRNHLSSPLARRFWFCEFFYSTVDILFYEINSFTRFLEQSKFFYALQTRLTRAEWGIIRSNAGKARRFSQKFIELEKGILDRYRSTFRQVHSQKSTNVSNGVVEDAHTPTPSVGQFVIAIHPVEKSLHIGSISEIDQHYCYVRFSHPNLGVHCIPDYQLQILPQNTTLSKTSNGYTGNQMTYSIQHGQNRQNDVSLQPMGRESVLDSYRNIAKLCILLNEKEKLLGSTQDMHKDVEQKVIQSQELGTRFSIDTNFQTQYASNIISLDQVNSQLQISLTRFTYFANIQDYADQLQSANLAQTEEADRKNLLPVDQPQDAAKILVQTLMASMLTGMGVDLSPESYEYIYEKVVCHFLVLTSMLTATHNCETGNAYLKFAIHKCKSAHPASSP